MTPASVARWLLSPEPIDERAHLWPRWIFLRVLGLIFFSAFYSLFFQIRGLIGPDGILPAGHFLHAVAQNLGASRYWYAPTLLWLGSGARAVMLLCWSGLAASALLVLNFWPRTTVLVCMVAFLSFISTAQDFANYQSDGMLLAAGFLCLFFAPPGLRPGLGARQPPSRASLFLLRWLWFQIYFESGVAKIASGDPEWRHLTAMDHYYENGPLPTWIGWYAQQLPHGFHAAVALLTLVSELGLVWMLFLPRRFRLTCFLILTPFQIGIILTANYAFLNHLVLALGFLLLDDLFLRSAFDRLAPRSLLASTRQLLARFTPGAKVTVTPSSTHSAPAPGTLFRRAAGNGTASSILSVAKMWLSGILLGWIFYVTTALLAFMLVPELPLPLTPIGLLQPFRIANQYGLFAVMTTARYEIEYQGSRDGQTWAPYPFRYKPQDPGEPPGIYAPYQPRFEWNLWFASLETWRSNTFVVRAEELLLENDAAVLSLFRSNPFPGTPPRQVRAVLWQYWFTDLATKRAQGLWWRRELRGLYAPTLEREPDGRIVVIQWPETALLPPAEQP